MDERHPWFERVKGREELKTDEHFLKVVTSFVDRMQEQLDAGDTVVFTVEHLHQHEISLDLFEEIARDKQWYFQYSTRAEDGASVVSVRERCERD